MEKIKVFIGNYGFGDEINNEVSPHTPIVSKIIEKIKFCGAEPVIHKAARYDIHGSIDKRVKLISECKYILNWDRIYLNSESDLQSLYYAEISYFSAAHKKILTDQDLNDWVVKAAMDLYERSIEYEKENFTCWHLCNGGLCSDCPINICLRCGARVSRD